MSKEIKLKIVLISALALPVIFYSRESIRKYQDNKVSVSAHRDNSQQTLPFPSVTICSGFRDGGLTPENILAANQSVDLSLDRIHDLTYSRSEFLTYFTQAVDNDFSMNMTDMDELWQEEIHEYYGGRCYSFNPPVHAKPGETNSIIFGIRNPERYWTYRCDNFSTEECFNRYPVFFHSKDAFIFNKGHKFVGQSFLFPEENTKMVLTLVHTRTKRLNRPMDPCEEDGSVAKFKDCIQKAYDEKAGCHLPWKEPPMNMRKCNGTEVHQRFVSIERNLWWDVDRTATESTRCLKPCHFEKFEWRRAKYAWEGIPRDLFPEQSQTRFAMQIFYVDTTTEITEEFMAYDGFNLIGETGGALGLFLGWSFLELIYQALLFVLERIHNIAKPTGTLKLVKSRTAVI